MIIWNHSPLLLTISLVSLHTEILECYSSYATIFHKCGLEARDTKYVLLIYGSYSRQPILKDRYCGCNSAPKTSNDKIITLTTNSYVGKLYSSIFEWERYKIEDEEEQLTVIAKLSVENSNRNHMIRKNCDGTKSFVMRLNRLPLQNRPILERTLKYALARRNQIENRLRKELLLARYFKEKFEGLLSQGTLIKCSKYKRKHKDLNNSNFGWNECSIVSSDCTFSDKTIRLVMDYTWRNTTVYNGKLMTPHVVD